MKVKRELIFICTGKDCKKSGSKHILKELKIDTDKEPLKGQCKLIQTKCLDMCKSAPLVIVKNQYFKKATASKVLETLKKP